MEHFICLNSRIKNLLMIIIVLSLIMGSIIIPKGGIAKAEWATVEGNNTDIQKTIVYNDTIVQTGKHNSADKDSNRYKTRGYYMTLEKYDLDEKFTSGENAKIETEFVPMEITREWDDGTTKTTEYTIQKKDFKDAAVALGITGEKLIADGATKVYLNNIFNVVKGENDTITNDGPDGKGIYGYQEMMAAEGWSSTTQNYLKGYYNFQYTLSPEITYTVNFVAVDENHDPLSGAKNLINKIIGDSLYSKPVIAGEAVKYSPDADNKTLLFGEAEYTLDHWDYTYTKSNDSTKSIDKQTNIAEIKFNAPDAKEGSVLTVYLVYDKAKAVGYKVKVIAEKPNGTYIMELTGETATKSDSSFAFDLSKTITGQDGKSYISQKKYFLTYEYPKKGNIIKDPTDNSYRIAYTMPVAVKDSVAVFHAVYDINPITPTPGPSVSPKPTPPVSATPTPTLPPETTPAAASVSMEFTSVVNTGILRADDRGSEKFVATLGVPTTESLYAQVLAKKYLLGYNFEKKVGKEYFNVEVSRNYILKWYSSTPASAGGPKLIQETVPIKQTITVERAYGYWEITYLECYKIDSAELYNYALPNGSITLTPNNSYYSPPSISVVHSSDPKDHIIAPDEAKNGIQLADLVVTPAAGKETTKPSVPKEDFTYIAKSMTGKAKVKSDSLVFNGTTIISSTISEKEAPAINTAAMPQCNDYTNANALYKTGNVIDAEKLNGTYPTSGTITYAKLAKINASRPDNPKFSIDGLNEVVVHTPVVCIPSITADNDNYVQLIKPTKGCTELVIDPDPGLSDFTVHISNNGYHSAKQGYYTRDFSKSLRDAAISYIASSDGILMNQVKFPYDVYIDKGKAFDSTDDEFIKAGTWIWTGRSSPRFYLPMTVNEGVYSVNFRTVAVNGTALLNSTEVYANTQLINYVATDTLKVEVSGRIYGLSVYDLSDYPAWQEVFRVTNSLDFKKDSTSYSNGTAQTNYNTGRYYIYSLGTGDQYGNDTGRNLKYTFPLVNGSNPKYTNVGILKSGYVVRYCLETTGNMFSDNCKVAIKPNFYYVDKNGNNRIAVDLYYTEYFNKKTQKLVKVGSALDQINLKDYSIGDLYQGIPDAELRQTAYARGIGYNDYITKIATMFNFYDIRLNWAFRTYTNNEYLNTVKAYGSYTDVKKDGIKESDILERMQRWYGEYYIPNEVHVVAKGCDVMDYADKHGIDYEESFWLKDGYIIVNFTIETIGEDGNRRLSYINDENYRENGNCSMWLLESPPLTKMSFNGPTFNFYAGDFILYYANKRMSDDYSSGSVY